MTKIYYEDDAEPSVLDGQTFAVVGFHSPTSQYGQLSRRGGFDDPKLAELWNVHANAGIATVGDDLRRRFGERVTPGGPAPD